MSTTRTNNKPGWMSWLVATGIVVSLYLWWDSRQTSDIQAKYSNYMHEFLNWANATKWPDNASDDQTAANEFAAAATRYSEIANTLREMPRTGVDPELVGMAEKWAAFQVQRSQYASACGANRLKRFWESKADLTPMGNALTAKLQELNAEDAAVSKRINKKYGLEDR